MEKDYPAETIEYADIGFIRRSVRLEKCNNSNDPFRINLSEKHISNLVERILNEIVGDRFMEVVLNPSLRNEILTDLLIERIKINSEKILFIQNKNIKYTEPEENNAEKKSFFSRMFFLNCLEEISPLVAFIVYRHNKLSLFCFKKVRKLKANLQIEKFFAAVCCNGSKELFNLFLEKEVLMCINKTIHLYHHVHIVSAFHNYEILEELLTFGIDANINTKSFSRYTPLIFAIAKDFLEDQDYYKKCQLSTRDKTLMTLLNKGAKVNLCDEQGSSPLYVACIKGHDSTAQLLLNYGADVNLCKKTGATPLYVACKNGHDSTVQLLLNNGADVNLCDKTGASPLYTAFRKGHDSIMQLLLNNGADVNLFKKNWNQSSFKNLSK